MIFTLSFILLLFHMKYPNQANIDSMMAARINQSVMDDSVSLADVRCEALVVVEVYVFRELVYESLPP